MAATLANGNSISTFIKIPPIKPSSCRLRLAGMDMFMSKCHVWLKLLRLQHVIRCYLASSLFLWWLCIIKTFSRLSIVPADAYLEALIPHVINGAGICIKLKVTGDCGARDFDFPMLHWQIEKRSLSKLLCLLIEFVLRWSSSVGELPDSLVSVISAL